MASGRPDWYQTVVIQGQHLNTFVPVGVDVNGNMIAVISSGNIDVGTITSMIDKDRDVRGLSGINKIPIAVDGTGHMLARMQGYDAPTLRDVKVDETGVMISRMKGLFGAALKDIQVDTSGNMIAVIKGDFAGALKTLAVDTNGIMKANLVVQDLDRLIMRTSFGPLEEADLSHAFAGIGTHTLCNINGAGTILGGFLEHDPAASHKNCSFRVVIDGTTTILNTFQGLRTEGIANMYANPYHLINYNDTTFRYRIGFVYGWTFDTNFQVFFSENVGAATVVGRLYYSINV